jgi:hypothetical protein
VRPGLRRRRPADQAEETRRLAAEYLDDEGALVLSGDEAWAYFRLADSHY